MKPRFLVALSVVLLMVLLPAAAVAQTGTQLLFQAPNRVGLAFDDQARCSELGAPCSIADNFLVPAGGMTIGQIELWGTYVDGMYECIDASTYTDSFAVFIHPDAGGVPDPGYEGFSSVTPDSRTPTGSTVMGCPEYKFVLNLDAPLSQAEGTWWIEIYNSGGENTAPGKYFAWEKGVQDANGPSLNNAAFWSDSTGWYSPGPGDWMALGLYSSPPAVPGLHVSGIKLTPVTGKRGVTSVTGVVTIVDDSGDPVNKAAVDATWTLGNGSTFSQLATTGRTGQATFRGAKDGPGTYTLCVNDVTKAGFAFAPVPGPCNSVIVP